MQLRSNKHLIVALTGGGTAGHVMPNIALVNAFESLGWRSFYIGSSGMERELIKNEGISYFEVSAGKLRRYLSLQNFFDIFKILLGFFQSLRILMKNRPDALFSKGGFVSVPVCYAAFCLGIPVFTHESDLTPGLATKLIAPIAKKIFYSFPETAQFLPIRKACRSGTPIRTFLLSGDRIKGLRHCGFDLTGSDNNDLPVLLVMGGSSGAQRINDTLADCLPEVVRDFRVIHQTGKGKQISFEHKNYRAFEFIGKELNDILAAADLVVSRAGSNAIFEFLALKKPMLLIPLEIGSRGDQVHNARSFEKAGWAKTLNERNLNPANLLDELKALSHHREQLSLSQAKAAQVDSAQIISREISRALGIDFL